MTLYHVYLEEDANGAALAHIPDLAGCAAYGADRAVALAALPSRIRAYLDWCSEHGDPLPEDGEIRTLLVEVARGSYRPWRRGGAGALFSADRAPLGDVELRSYLRRMSYARADLLSLVRALPEGGLDTAAPGQHQTVRRMLVHIADAEEWYVSRLGQRITVEPSDDILHRLIDGRARAVEAMLRLSPRQRDLVYVPTDNPSEDPEEAWTLRKVLRYFLEHELTHVRSLSALDLAAWPLA